MTFEAATGALESLLGSALTSLCVLLLVAFEGLFGGLAYVNVFHRLNRDGEDEPDRRKTEFRIASVGLADTSGIVRVRVVASSAD
jgi:battenin